MPYENSFAALSHPLRQDILTTLGAAPASVRELTDQMSVSQPVMSQHLKVLRDAGLVSLTPRGARNIYQVEPEALAALRSYLDQHWLTALQGLGRKDATDD